jgi:hypothetical protein
VNFQDDFQHKKNEENIQEVQKVVHSNRMTIYEVEEEYGISKTTCHEILTENLAIHQVGAKFVPHLLGEDQTRNHVGVSKDLVNCANASSQMMKLGFTSVILQHNHIFHNGSQKTSPRPKKVQQVCSNVKAMLTVFFDCDSVIHHEFLSRGQMVNKQCYLKLMKRLREALRIKRPEFWRGE